MVLTSSPEQENICLHLLNHFKSCFSIICAHINNASSVLQLDFLPVNPIVNSIPSSMLNLSLLRYVTSEVNVQATYHHQI